MTRHIDITPLRAVKIDYASVGDQRLEFLGKTDKAWLIEAFGEPAAQQACKAAFPIAWRNAISRFSWSG